mmetsp:Transcript_11259/g.12736  ORF Transcript_11259/g.12736 Transcript_11259/m.12736 type:complete len:412 (-) Transcript_11259:2-1237(-)
MVFGLKLIILIIKIIRQSSTSFYVLDREKSGASLYQTLTNGLKNRISEDRDVFEREYKDYAEPKAWRPIFVMNELNELLASNIISIEVVLIWVSFILVGEGWQYAALYDPRVERSDSRSPSSYILMFFIVTLTIMLTGFILYALRYAVYIFWPLDFMNFVDLCSVANVSLFIFDEKFHGYYIHGESPGLSSDVTLDALKKILDSEGKGLAKQRGISTKNPDLQTFEFYMPYGERKRFDDVFKESAERLQQSNKDQVVMERSKRSDFIYKFPDVDLCEEDFRKIISKKDELDYYLVTKISDARINPNNYIADVTFLYNLFKLPPTAISSLQTVRFVADKFMNFTRVLFSEMDFDILWIMSCFFTALDALGFEVMHSVLIFYVFYRFGLRWFRAEMGENILSKTSGIDSRFLI